MKLTALLSLPKVFIEELKEGGMYTIVKGGVRIMPFEIPMELSTHDHVYVGKVKVVELRVFEGKTEVTFKVLKLFSDRESKVYTENFIKP